MSLPPVPFFVQVIADYTPTSGSDVPLKKGEIYEVIAVDDRAVWAQAKNLNGWLPIIYTTVLPTPPAVSSTPVPKINTSRENVDSSSSTETQKTATNNENVKTLNAIKNNSIQSQPAKRPAPTKTHTITLKNKKNEIPPTTVLVQEGNKNMEITVFVTIRSIKDKEYDEKRFGSTETSRKTNEPKWNEEFSVSVYDAEDEILVIKVCNGKEYNKKKIIGEVEIILRSSERDFDSPSFQYRWYRLKKRDNTGQLNEVPDFKDKVMLYLQYRDNRETSRPTNFKRLGHIGMDKDGNFDLDNLPPEWISKFRELGIKKKDLKKNAQFANTVFDIMNKSDASASTVEPSTSQEAGAYEGSTQYGIPPAPPVQGYNIPDASKMAPNYNISEVVAPPPPPPPAGYDYGSVGNNEQLDMSKPPPPPPTQPASGDRGNLLSSIHAGTVLRKVENRSAPQPTAAPAAGGVDLTDLLKRAIQDMAISANGDSTEANNDDDSDWE